MSKARIYLDTSFFIALLENQEGRQDECKKIVRWEDSQNNVLFTSMLTLNEFLVRYYDKYRNDPQCENYIENVVRGIRAIAKPYGFSEEVMKRAAKFQSIRGAQRTTSGLSPREKKFRWDAIHLATADCIRVERVYAFDGPWNDFPKGELSGISTIICPARMPIAEQELIPFAKPAPEDQASQESN